MNPSNFRQPKRRLRRGSMDGIITPASFKRGGSINHQAKKHDVEDKTNKLDNFDRVDGYHPASRVVEGTESHTPTVIQTPVELPTGPRRRGKDHTNIHSPNQLKSKNHRPWKKIAKKSAIVLAVLLILVSGFLGWKVLKNTGKIFKGGIFGLLQNTKLKGEDVGRVNILLAGNSSDDPGHAGADLTDSIMLVSIDTVNNNGFMISIPRDLWVTYGPKNCAAGYQGRINAAYVCGEEIKFHQDGYPDGGMGLLTKVVKENFGIEINYYTKINYKAFRDAVNNVGGIDVTIQSDDPRGLYDANIAKVDGGPLKLSNGKQHLDGQTALNLARARGDTISYGFPRSDFDRTEHQRQMLLSLKDKALSVGVLSNPAKISSLLDTAGNNVETNFKTDELRRLYDIVQKINNSNVKSIGLADKDVNLVQGTMINGASIQRPVAGLTDFSEIQAFIKRLSSNDPVVKEGARAVVLNGSGVAGLAQTHANILKAKGLFIKAVANSNAIKPSTTVVIMKEGQMPSTKDYLEQKYGVKVTTDLTANPEAQYYESDFVIILGANAVKTAQ